MKYLAFPLLMLPLAACFNDQKQQLAQCELDAQQQHIYHDDEPRYTSTCMMAHGYEDSFTNKKCGHASELDSFLDDFPFYKQWPRDRLLRAYHDKFYSAWDYDKFVSEVTDPSLERDPFCYAPMNWFARWIYRVEMSAIPLSRLPPSQ
jgi:hypothetical protein